MKNIFKINVLWFVVIMLLTLSFTSCDNAEKTNEKEDEMEEMKSTYEISLAQWSLHKSFFGDLGND